MTRPVLPIAAADSRRRVPALDGLRGVAILMVMVFHMTVLADVARPDRPWVDRTWVAVAEFGWTGVDLFFVLSGFLITGILLDGRGGAGYFGSFYARRSLRTFPLYYLIVCFALLLLPHVPNAKSGKFGSIHGDEAWYWTLSANWIIGYRHAFRHGILDVTWSLAIEEQFYLLWPAVVLWASRRALPWVCGGLIAAAVATRTGLFLSGASPIRILTWTPCRMDALAAGAAVAALARRPGGLVALRPVARWVAGGLGVTLAGYLAWQGPSWDGGAFGQCLGYSALALCFAAVVTLLATADPTGAAARVFGWSPLRQLGRYSYALYLFHFPIRALVRDTVYGPSRFLTLFGSQLPGQLLFYAIVTSISFALAWVSWHLLESPALGLKRHFPNPGASQKRP